MVRTKADYQRSACPRARVASVHEWLTHEWLTTQCMSTRMASPRRSGHRLYTAGRRQETGGGGSRLRIEVSVVRRSGEVCEVDAIGPAPRAAVCTVTRRESTDTSGSSWRRVKYLSLDGTAVHRPGGRAVPPATPRPWAGRNKGPSGSYGIGAASSQTSIRSKASGSPA